jgi:nuclear pore complex protein Nup107
MDKAILMCESNDQPWRAASLRGGIYRSDYELDVEYEQNNLNNIETLNESSGNSNRILWKFTCYTLAQQDIFDPYERALYAVLSGDFDNILPVVNTWEDYVWAYYSVLIEHELDRKIQEESRGGIYFIFTFV